MSMITRCPACETMFRVVPDQLRISAGWVRCGRCDEVFDASEHLLADTPSTDASEVAPVPVPPVMRVVENAPPVPPAPPVLIASFEGVTEVVPLSEPAPSPELPLPYLSDFQDLDLNLNLAEVPTETEFVSIEEPPTVSDKAELESLELLEAKAFEDMALDAEVTAPTSELEEVAHTALAVPELPPEPISFLLNEREIPGRGRASQRWFLLVLSLLLLLGLVSQGVYREHNRLAAWEPRMEPWLARACDAMGCTMGPVQDMDAISVDSSTFTKLRSDGYRLSFSLKNRASTPVAFPAIELTLTDALDRPFLRRILRASDLGFTETALAAGAEWLASIDLAVESTAMPDRVAGYRLVAFYP